MKKGEWTFLSNHGRVLIYIFNNPKSTTEEISRETELSQRGVQKIITELETEGYIAHKKEGRRNHYTVHSELPMRHHLEQNHMVGDIIRALGYSHEKSTMGRSG
ncbi:MAG: winged helix-turn-helix transcriptional regulator [Dehalococcoidales bacterium]|nr:winged helix-turn-helix transcriptional regulator [Dehalococcoidales bacterium]